MQRKITDDLDALLDVLPAIIRARVREIGRTQDLLEIILDLGRAPTARYLDGERVLSDVEVQTSDIEAVVKRIGEFDEDNRAGLERTLHRISAIRNRRGHIVGLTCRVGRAVYGTIDIIEDMVTSGKSVLLLGRPGVGKTTLLREAARVLAETKRVVIVDTSNEIGGDGDIPHPAVGKARRMQVSNPSLQHEVMIEAVENHNPEVIIIDEIGREMEAAAARTIAERGVQLIGTAHGNTLDNILLNPTLADLVGGIESVTLSDEEARRRGTQKTVLERRSPPTFDVLIEIQERERLLVHPEVADIVDAVLRGRAVVTELRFRDESGEIRRQTQETRPEANRVQQTRDGRGRTMPWHGERPRAKPARDVPAIEANGDEVDPRQQQLEPYSVYAYGLTRNRLERVARRLRVPLKLVDDLAAAQALVTLKSYYRRRQRPISDAESRGMPIYVLRSNTAHQMENFLLEVFGMSLGDGEWDARLNEALRETRAAIQQVLNGTRTVDLGPQEAGV
ncbi:MAG: AAA family ATPase, partial [Anaerolineales bacterium]